MSLNCISTNNLSKKTLSTNYIMPTISKMNNTILTSLILISTIRIFIYHQSEQSQENQQNEIISSQNHQPHIQQDDLIQKQSKFISLSTRTNQIQVKSKDISLLKKQMTIEQKNNRLQTQNTGKHLKVITLDILRVLTYLKILSSNEVKAVIKFKNSNGSRRDFKELMQHSIIKFKSFQYFSSSSFVKKILQSSKMTMKNKIILLKYLEQLRSVTYMDKHRWKTNKLQ